MSDKTIEQRAIEWATGNDTGMSSNALCRYMTSGGEVGRPPSDADDRGRCIRLLQLIPEWIPRLDELAQHETPSESLVFGSGGMRTETYSWAVQIPLIRKEGGF